MKLKTGLFARHPRRLTCAAFLIATTMAGSVFAQDQTPVKGGTLTVARPADVNLWDPKFTNDNDSIWAQTQIYATLLQNSPDGTQINPWLAESWTMNDAATEFTFHLHDDAFFCDGTKITADDVKYSFDRIVEPDSQVSWQFPGSPKIDVVDPLTIKITLQAPNVAFSNYLTLWGAAVLSKAHSESIGNAGISEKPLGSGPFCLIAWIKGSDITLTRNPGYWDPDKPYVDTVVLHTVQDDSARLLQVRTGAVDIALAIPANLAGALKDVPGVKTSMETVYGTAAIVPNVRTVPALADVKVRQAMTMAIDRQAMVDALLFGNGKPAQSPFYGPGILFWTDAYAVKFDVDAAKALLAQSGFPDGFAATLTIPSGDQLAQQTATIFADQMSKLNIEIAISPVEAGTWWDNWSGGDFELLYKLGTNDIIDPSENIPFDFWSSEEGGGDSAHSGYRSDEIVALSKSAEAELDVTKRQAIYDDVQRIAMAESPQFYLFHPTTIWATRDAIHGFAMFPTKSHRFWDVWIDAK